MRVLNFLKRKRRVRNDKSITKNITQAGSQIWKKTNPYQWNLKIRRVRCFLTVGTCNFSSVTMTFRKWILSQQFSNKGCYCDISRVTKLSDFTNSRRKKKLSGFHVGFSLFSRITNDIVFTISRALSFSFTMFTKMGFLHDKSSHTPCH